MDRTEGEDQEKEKFRGMNMKEWALKYLEIGWTPIPLIPGDKLPLLREWKPYQNRKPSIEEIEEWSRKWPNANVGIVTGQASGIIVFDMDREEAQASDHQQRDADRSKRREARWYTRLLVGEMWFHRHRP